MACWDCTCASGPGPQSLMSPHMHSMTGHVQSMPAACDPLTQVGGELACSQQSPGLGGKHLRSWRPAGAHLEYVPVTVTVARGRCGKSISHHFPWGLGTWTDGSPCEALVPLGGGALIVPGDAPCSSFSQDACRGPRGTLSLFRVGRASAYPHRPHILVLFPE